jgi:biopolymer transport protein ExbB/TolQ
MKCNNIDTIILWALILTAAGDLVALFAELLNQRCEKKAEQERQRKEEIMSLELESLRRRIAILETKNIL